MLDRGDRYPSDQADDRSRYGERPHGAQMLVNNEHFGPPQSNYGPPQDQYPQQPIPPPHGPQINNHQYPPSPMDPPYPTNGALITMPHDDNYPSSRSNSFSNEHQQDELHLGLAPPPRHMRPHSTGDPMYRDDRDRGGDDYYYQSNGQELVRGRPEYIEDKVQRHRSSTSTRLNNRDDEKDSRKLKMQDIWVSAAGGVAGGFIGHEVKRKDWKATAAGVVLGALGAHAAGKGWAAHKRKERKEDDQWEEQNWNKA